ncbi:TRCF domain-containing protein [uncultured Sphingomonas sp.]|uniref:TRCF domain-containing protein n=1 Tax=uncultured Sphingomonas sp. TaxID=158754 RepID=UPI0035CAECE7
MTTDKRDQQASPPAVVAAALCGHPGPVVFVAADDGRAAAVAEIAAALAPDRLVLLLPSSDALPGDDAPASPANAGQRIAALRRLRAAVRADEASRVLLVATAEASAVRQPAPETFDAAPPCLAAGDPIDPQGLAALAQDIGYVVDDLVDEPGAIAIRGQVIDLFPVDLPRPMRIEVADGRVARLRFFDAATQVSDEACRDGGVDAVEIGHAREPDATGGVPLTDHLPGAAVAMDAEAPARRAAFLKLAADGLSHRKVAAGLVDDKAWQKALADRDRIELAPAAEAPPRFVERHDPARAFARFVKARFVEDLGQRRLVLTGCARDLRFLRPRLERAAKLAFVEATSWADVLAAPAGSVLALPAPIDRGFAIGDVTVVASGDVLGGRAGSAVQGSGGRAALAGPTGELARGDVVVHEEFGLGMVEGLETLPDGGDAIRLGYAKDTHRLVPVMEADRLWRYGADADAVCLDALDGSSWQKRRGALAAAVAEGARALLAVAAERDARRVEPVTPDRAAYEKFAAGFPFTETPDQARAIAAVLDDLTSGRPMDRLIVGDVGYGKTEVALRAAAAVALSGRQVALAAPTTVLARQHLETFHRRFEGTGVEVAGLSRLTGAAEKKRVLAGLADGSIGVVVGTAAVAGKGVAYRDLALAIVDEEQRFGAADKARLHGLGGADAGGTHVLTMSATPIPRTLQAAMVGLQPVSVIATPPARRQPIRTTVTQWNDQAVRAALLRERARGGQSFVVVPRIEDMGPLEQALRTLAPELTLVTAHGKMPAAAMDEAMVGFGAGKGDVLLATNIIEAGLDVPRANTMIVHRADRFGLSQLHQLRGRVGRGGRRGQIMLATQEGAAIAPATLRRLKTLEAFDQLGAGFQIGARDLDLRGAGDLVGEEQAGHMKLVGVDLYQHLFALALKEARGEAVDDWVPDLKLDLGGRLPDAWIPEEEVRLALYGRLARLTGAAALDAFEAELEDRFGALPDEAARLLATARIRLLARAAGVARIDAGPAAIAFTPRRAGQVAAVEGLEEKGDRLIARVAIAEAAERAHEVERLLEAMG